MNEISTFLAALPGIIALLALTYTIYKDYWLRKEDSFFKAISGLSNPSPASRAASLLLLEPAISSVSFSRSNRRRQGSIVQILATQLVSEKDQYVRSLCSRALSSSSFQVKPIAIRRLHELNLETWDNRNMTALQGDSPLNYYNTVLGDINQTLINLLRKRLIPRVRAVDLRGIHLDFSILSAADLSRCDLTGATLSHVDFSNARLRNTIFDRAVIINSYFRGNSLRGASFEGAVIARCRLAHLQSHTCLNQARALFRNIYRDTPSPQKESGDNDWLKEVYLTEELNWKGIWISSTEDESVLDAEWRAPYTDEVVTARMVKPSGSRASREMLRTGSSDLNDGSYHVTKIAPLNHDIECVGGHRILAADRQEWRGIRWLLIPSHLPNAAAQARAE